MRNISRNIQQLKTSKGKRYYKSIKYPEIPILDEDLYIISIVGDRVDNLARQYYGDSNLWWIISSANSEIIKGGSFVIKPGLEIRIPSNQINVLEDYNTLNK